MIIHKIKAIHIIITGDVQGVGFRPFVYKLAIKSGLKGFVLNNNIGVEIEIEGLKENIDSFKGSLLDDLPPLAKIDNIEIKEIEPFYKEQFEILHSNCEFSTSKIASVSPDSSICKECEVDISLTSKYKNYFATNCTNCGPRYSIIQTVPYDRVNTSMRNFPLCDSCEKEYKNPLNRRYHAQPISCNNCGPELSLYLKDSKINTPQNNLLEMVSNFIKVGKIGAIKGIGGFHIVCDATNDKVIEKLRVYKNRPTKPFAIMCKDLKQIQSFSNISKKEKELLLGKEAPIVILKRLISSDLTISSLISPNIDRIGCVLPYTALHKILFSYLDNPIIATSANLSGEPIITTKEDIDKKLPFLDFVLDYNRDIVNAIDDSVVQVVDDDILIMRLSRGYAPKEIKLPFKIDKKILSVGANDKNSIALAFSDKIILSPYIGDISNLKSFEFFTRTLDTFKRFYDFEPDIVIHDKHPSYETTKWAKQHKKYYAVQHHLAHIYSVKAEFRLTKDYIGFSFDGTGYGEDDTLWGGEVFIGDERNYHFKPIKLLGGEKAIKEPRRVALSLLFDKYSLEDLLSLDLNIIKQFKKDEIELLYQSWIKDLNSPLSSSVGRLFDAIASFSDICHFQSYEGEAGLMCEKYYNCDIKDCLEYEIIDGIIDIKIVDYILNNQNINDKTILISRFINTLVNIIFNITIKENKDVILSGGVFQNKTLLELIIKKFKENNIKYYYNQTTAINDSGIALGQIYYYLLQDACASLSLA